MVTTLLCERSIYLRHFLCPSRLKRRYDGSQVADGALPSSLVNNSYGPRTKAAAMTASTAATALDPRLKNVHPLFYPSRFTSDIDYYGAIYDSAVLANRLLNTPQGLQSDYCFYYGKNVPANQPVDYIYHEHGHRPFQYACDKGIGELDGTDLRYVEQQRNHLAERIHFRVANLDADTFGVCNPQDPEDGIRGCKSIIEISRSKIYDKLLAPGQSPNDCIRVKFLLALTMLHELAHAAHFHLFGLIAFEGFRENSLVAEAGFESESRFFGQVPGFDLQAANPHNRVTWSIWQSREGLAETYDLRKLARNAWKLPEATQSWSGGLQFIKKLFEEDFWEGDTSDYVQHGALALIPAQIATSCRSGSRDNMAKSIPLSIKDLFRDGGLSYAKKYARFANPERKVRAPIEYDSGGYAIL